MDTATEAAPVGTLPLSPSLLGSDAISLDFLGSSRKRKASDDPQLLPPQPLLSAENSANGTSTNNNGTLTARAEPGSFRIKIQRSTPRQGGSRLPNPMTASSNLAGGLQFPMQFNPMPTFMPQQFPSGMATIPATTYMPNHVMNQMNFQTHMLQQQQQNAAAFLSTSLGPPPPGPQSLLPQNSLLGNEGQDLGPPPSAPPRMAVEHSLMGGGIEVQPVRAVDTRNFDWNRRAGSGAATTIAEDGEGLQGQNSGRPRSESLPNISLGFLDGLTLQSESSFFKEV
ncbi:hypothetical protein H310_06834 [Aphanomyces invadans]|uniref:Uncharacterized protein n=1 Tax=Aphanomyces invadans TaxID=157072 RepID=A0A024U4A4_9STRA|nr:hypothetical protein H310_06834 [Aphanomyces invadans]ETW01251.1 hypothetical protein H310_06834 [Aphanomyces invadans]|eukprot:XP_008870249.1 hypothetical protein H310_06834 [Aphanomyces invadans]